jgi:hypothetical protein
VVRFWTTLGDTGGVEGVDLIAAVVDVALGTRAPSENEDSVVAG